MISKWMLAENRLNDLTILPDSLERRTTPYIYVGKILKDHLTSSYLILPEFLKGKICLLI
jgi:hypothetical protein